MRRFKVKVEGKTYEVEVEEIQEASPRQPVSPPRMPSVPIVPAPSPVAAPQAGGGIRAPMAGKILEVKKKEGDAVSSGEIVFVMESMKMEVYVRSAQNGLVHKIHAGAGKVVEANTLLAEVA